MLVSVCGEVSRRYSKGKLTTLTARFVFIGCYPVYH